MNITNILRDYRNLCEDVKNTTMDEAESEIKKNVLQEGEKESNMSAVRRKQDEIVNNLDEIKIVSMAARWENVPEGYDVTRFVGEVKEDLLCLICNEVPKDPRLCKNKDHVFCLAHISKHLENSQTCPYCRDSLTRETLRRPTGFLKNYLDDLKIKCDHHGRGCPDVVRLEDLPKHVDHCGFASVMCGNEGCGVVVNKREKENHEKYLCKFRIVKYHDCKEIKASHDEMKASHDELKTSQDEWNDEMKVNLNETKHEITGLERKQKNVQDEMKVEFKKMKDKMTGIERQQDQMQQSVDEMKQQFTKMMRMFNQALQGSNVNNNGVQATDPRVSVNNQNIIILGGYYAEGVDEVSNTVEKFNIVEGTSTKLPPMNKPRGESAACVYNGDVIVTGGFDGHDGTDSIEIVKINQHRWRWIMFDGKLPVKLSGHSSIIYQNKLYVIGGYNWNEKKTSDIIYELELAPPYAPKLLVRMPQARTNHRAEIVNGRLFIYGGRTTGNNKDASDSVVVYNFITKEFKTCPSLSGPVSEMSTVTWGNTVIVVGGVDKNDEVLNDVIMYDTETGRSERLPSLKHKRCGSSAVITDDIIVVFGGWNAVHEHLNSVESFTMGSDGWKELAKMKEKRSYASVVVIPRI